MSVSRIERMLSTLKESATLNNEDFARVSEVLRNFESNENTQRRNSSLNGELSFGKHKGKTLQVISKEDPSYILWLKKDTKYLTKLQKDILATIGSPASLANMIIY